MNIFKPTTRLWISSLSIRGGQWTGVQQHTTGPRCQPRRIGGVARFASTSSTVVGDPHDEDEDRQKHIKRYKLEGETMEKNKSGVRVVTDTGHVLQTDLPRTMGGQDTAPQPVETLLAAWMGCTQATALFVSRHVMGKPPNRHRRRLLIDRLVFDNIRGERDERGAIGRPVDDLNPPVPSRLLRVSGRIMVHLRVGNQGEGRTVISPEELDLLREQTELRCPIANMMIASGCRMDVEWISGGDDDTSD